MSRNLGHCGWICCVILLAASARAAETPPVEFNRDIRPLLSDHCFQCHGPDEKSRKADLRLDTEAGAFADLGGHAAIVPGNLTDSELIARITSTDPNEQMPPPGKGHDLTPAQIELFKQWVAQGAKWQPHWSWVPPRKPDLPEVNNAGWCRNPIDYFVLSRLEQAGLEPAAPADRITWLRRVSLDLTGLPPTPEEVDAFLADESEQAFERVVDRLLKSPRYGERMAARWLDGARYADTSGYQSDGERFMWRYRDWVIDAYNRNLPFDQFTVEQLAGDLLPHPTLDQRIATGFNRNHRGNSEGGIVPEEYAVEYVVDRVDTTFTVWLGLTMGCARCHDHKFDPLSQRDYYQTFALFNNVPEKGRAMKFGNSPPYIPAPTRPQQEELAHLDAELADARKQVAVLQPELDRLQQEWEATRPNVAEEAGDHREHLLVRYRLEGNLNNDGEGGGEPLPVGQWRDGNATFGTGAAGQAADFDGQRFIDAGNLADFGYMDRFSCSLWVRPTKDGRGTLLSRGTDAPEADGWSIALEDGAVHVRLTKRWLDDAMRVATIEQLVPETWQHITVTYDGSRFASGVTIYINGKPANKRVLLDELNQTITTKEPLRIGGGCGPQSRFQGQLDDVRVYQGMLTAEDAAVLATPDTVTQIALIPTDQRTAGQALKLARYYLEAVAPDAMRTARHAVTQLEQRRQSFIESLPTVMVMEELADPRPAYILKRGEYDKKGDQVFPALPASLVGPNPPSIHNRLDFARWLVQPDHPLTARVQVNRLWQQLFGQGLVKTVDDFGAQGAWPTHPALLDWLATEFIHTGWDQKQLLKTIVLSATYRQSSKPSALSAQKDPDNALLSHGPRQRFSAEMVRDQALAASGLLVEQLGGPSVYPYQPDGLWNELTENATYVQDHGDKLYRRGLYTFWKRTIAPPAMILFDAAGRETCLVKETRTNTPLQALNLMNDVTYLEAARVLAQRCLSEAEPNTAARLTRAFRLVLSRPPEPRELEVLTRSLEFHRQRFMENPTASEEYLHQGETPLDPKLDRLDVAAYAAVGQLLLNLDEAITKR